MTEDDGENESDHIDKVSKSLILNNNVTGG